MKSTSYWMIALPSVLAFIAVLYFLPGKKQTAQLPPTETHAHTHSDQAFSIQEMEEDAVAKLPEADKKMLQRMYEDTASDLRTLQKLKRFWYRNDSLGNPLLGLYYDYLSLVRSPNTPPDRYVQQGRFFNLLAFEAKDIHVHNALLDWAVDVFDRAYVHLPKDDSLRVDRAAVQLYFYPEEGRTIVPPMEVIAAIKKVIEDHPKQTYARYVLGMASLMSGQSSKAVDYFEQVVQLTPNDQNVIRLLVDTYAEMGNQEKSKAWERKLTPLSAPRK